jgi:hypothetical protein
METVGYCLQVAVGCFTALVFVYSVYRLAKLDLLRRMAGTLGFLCGATAEALNVDLTMTLTFLAEWTIFGCFLLGVLFQREIKQLLR